ncbi:MAG: DUF2189 domain-containing protein [Pseudomonadota bacterium]
MSDAQVSLKKPEGYRPPPKVLSLGVADIADAAGRGMADFRAQPMYGLIFGGLYAVGGIIVLLAAAQFDMVYLSYPLATGFALIGPFIATGLYEVSRRLENNGELSLGGVFAVIFEQRKRELSWMAFVVLFIFIMWMYQVRLLLALFLGFEPISTLPEFLDTLLTTTNGLLFLAVGHMVGAILAATLFSLSVISFPMLLDRDVDFITAMVTSVQTVVKNPIPMLGWAAVVTALLIVASIPMFLGLLVVLPILGHTTWHIYRKAVAEQEPPAAASGKRKTRAKPKAAG